MLKEIGSIIANHQNENLYIAGRNNRLLPKKRQTQELNLLEDLELLLLYLGKVWKVQKAIETAKIVMTHLSLNQAVAVTALVDSKNLKSVHGV